MHGGTEADDDLSLPKGNPLNIILLSTKIALKSSSYCPETNIGAATLRLDLCKGVSWSPHRLLCWIYSSCLLGGEWNMWTWNEKDYFRRSRRQGIGGARVRGLCARDTRHCCRTQRTAEGKNIPFLSIHHPSGWENNLEPQVREKKQNKLHQSGMSQEELQRMQEELLGQSRAKFEQTQHRDEEWYIWTGCTWNC